MGGRIRRITHVKDAVHDSEFFICEGVFRDEEVLVHDEMSQGKRKKKEQAKAVKGKSAVKRLIADMSQEEREALMKKLTGDDYCNNL